MACSDMVKDHQRSWLGGRLEILLGSSKNVQQSTHAVGQFELGLRRGIQSRVVSDSDREVVFVEGKSMHQWD